MVSRVVTRHVEYTVDDETICSVSAKWGGRKRCMQYMALSKMSKQKIHQEN